MPQTEFNQKQQLDEARRLRRLEQRRRQRVQIRLVLFVLLIIAVLSIVLIVRGCRADKAAPKDDTPKTGAALVTTEPDTTITIAAVGEYRKPVFVRRITDREGKLVADFAPGASERALSQEASLALIDMLRGVVDRGTGGGVRYRFGIYGDVAGKTGTTQNNTDGWFILMHPNLVAGAWVGFNDNRVAIRSTYWGQGGHNAALVVGDFFKSALDGGSLDAQAQFPGARKPEPRRYEEAPEEVYEVPDQFADDESFEEVTPPQDGVPIESSQPVESFEPVDVPPPAPPLEVQPAPVPAPAPTPVPGEAPTLRREDLF